MSVLVVIFLLLPAACIIGFIVFLTNVSRKTRVITLAIILGLMLGFGIYGKMKQRSVPGRIIRYFAGDGMHMQKIKDRAEDLRGSAFMDRLRTWSDATLSRFHQNQLLTVSNGIDSNFWFPDDPLAIRLAPEEKPDFIEKQWGSTNGSIDDPQLFILKSTNSELESIVVAWYEDGIIVGPTNYSLPDEFWYQSQIQPGVYSYSFFPK